MPQARNRVFVIAIRDLEPAHTGVIPDTHVRRYKVRHVFERNRDLPWILFDLPRLPDRTITLRDVLVDLPEDDPRWWNADRMKYFWEHLEKDHRTKLIDLVRSNMD